MENFLKNNLGITVENIIDGFDRNGYVKLSKDDFARLDAMFQHVPHILKEMKDADLHEGAYRVIYDKGLGELQRAAGNPELLRANIVANGQNNNVVGQALLQEIKSNSLLDLSNIALAVFNVASIATSQYFLARIDGKLSAIDAKVNEIQEYLEIEKESEIWADCDYLQDTMKKAQFMKENARYCEATITSIQSIRRTSLANIKLFHKKLMDLENKLNAKDKEKALNDKISQYSIDLPKFWISVYLFELAYYLEVYLSDVTNSKYLEFVIEEMNHVLDMYVEGYNIIKNEINKYIDEVNALKPNELPLKVLKNVGKMLEFTNIGYNPFIRLGLKGLGLIFDIGADELETFDKMLKENKKKVIVESLENIDSAYSDVEPLKEQIAAVAFINKIYNNKVEIIVEENEAYMKFDETDKEKVIQIAN